jgi:hypothetical protein
MNTTSAIQKDNYFLKIEFGPSFPQVKNREEFVEILKREAEEHAGTFIGGIFKLLLELNHKVDGQQLPEPTNSQSFIGTLTWPCKSCEDFQGTHRFYWENWLGGQRIGAGCDFC